MTSAVGRHRAPRPRSTARRPVSRASAAGATLALPVIGAGTASALDGGSDTYTVASGDTRNLSQVDVSPCATVGMGDRIALSGATGNVTGPHLHFEVRTTPEYGSAIDPLDWLREHGVET